MTIDDSKVQKGVVEKLLFPSLASVKLCHRKLDGSNWKEWQIIVLTNLTGQGKDTHVTDDPPAPMTAEWKKDDNLIKGLLWEVMERDICDSVLTCSTVKEMWELLKTTYSRESCMSRAYSEKNSMSRAYSVAQAYSRSKMGSQTLEEYYIAFKKLCDELREIFPLEADLMKMQERQNKLDVLTFLGSLPQSYDGARSLVMAGSASKNLHEAFYLIREMFPTRPSLESVEVKSSLAATHPKTGSGQGGGRTGRGGGRDSGLPGRGSGSISGSFLDSVMCYYCKKYGHMKFDCPRKKKRSSAGHLASVANREHIDDEMLALFRLFQQFQATQSQSSSSTILAKSGPGDEMDDWHRA